MRVGPGITRRVIRGALSIALLLAAAGCGGSDERKDREDIERVLTDSIQAVHAGDREKACPLYTSAYVRENLRENPELKLERDTCEELVDALEVVFKQLTPNPDPKVTKIEVAGDKATARLEIDTAFGPAASKMFVVRERDRWKIDHDEDLRTGPERRQAF